MFAVNKSRFISDSSPPSLHAVHVKLLLTTSSVSPQWNSSSVSVFPCLRVKVPYRSNVTFRSFTKSRVNLAQKSLVVVSCIWRSG